MFRSLIGCHNKTGSIETLLSSSAVVQGAHEITKEALQHEQSRKYEKVTKQTVSAVQHRMNTETPCLQHQLRSCMAHWMPGIVHNNNTAAEAQ